MEIILGILGVIGIWVGATIVLRIVSAGTAAAGRAVTKAVTGKETYVGSAQLKFLDETNNDLGLSVKKLMFRGLIPNLREMDLSCAVSLFDSTGGDLLPVISIAEAAQESQTAAFGLTNQLGEIGVGAGFTDWVQMGVVIPDLLQPPMSGEREITLVFRLFNTNKAPTIVLGFVEAEGEEVLTHTLTFMHQFDEKGYKEAAEHREEAQALALKLGVVVAMSDGSLDDAEGNVLKDWIVREVSSFSEEKKTDLKALYNGALKEGFEENDKGTLTISALVDRLSEIGDKKTKYNAIELCLDVMAADGLADPEEMVVIRSVASSLDLDMDEIEKMREQVTLNLSTELTSEEGLESLVGIDSSWSNEFKRKHLRSEFQKWSNRLTSLSEGEEKTAAQSMLDKIAVLRKKYD
jgi:tellurite resistance protein